jgi:phage/plasmid primase-like uncharacterized protein
MTERRIIEDFRVAITKAGLPPPRVIIPDGAIHPFSTDREPDDKAGRYALYLDGTPAGWFMDWRTGVTRTWRTKASHPMSASERNAHRQRLQALRTRRDEEERTQQAEAAQLAGRILSRATPVQEGHPYLTRKQIPFDCVRSWLMVDNTNSLLLPVRTRDGLLSIQHIARNGDKRFLAGGRTKGGRLVLLGESTPNIVVLAEGFATACSLRHATGLTTVIAFSAHNLLTVARDLREEDPTGTIVIAADNDFHPDGEPNTGLLAAEKAAKAVSGIVAIPPVLDNGPTDWCDRRTAINALSGTVSPERALRFAVCRGVQAWLDSPHEIACPVEDITRGTTADAAYQTLTDVALERVLKLKQGGPYERRRDRDGEWRIRQRAGNAGGAMTNDTTPGIPNAPNGPPAKTATSGDSPAEGAKPLTPTDVPANSSASCGPGGAGGPQAVQEQENCADCLKNDGGPKRSSGPQPVEFPNDKTSETTDSSTEAQSKAGEAEPEPKTEQPIVGQRRPSQAT